RRNGPWFLCSCEAQEFVAAIGLVQCRSWAWWFAAAWDAIKRVGDFPSFVTRDAIRSSVSGLLISAAFLPGGYGPLPNPDISQLLDVRFFQTGPIFIAQRILEDRRFVAERNPAGVPRAAVPPLIFSPRPSPVPPAFAPCENRAHTLPRCGTSHTASTASGFRFSVPRYLLEWLRPACRWAVASLLPRSAEYPGNL